jgi:hypothetical protein
MSPVLDTEEIPLFCPHCKSIVRVGGDSPDPHGTRYWWCDTCDEPVDPVLKEKSTNTPAPGPQRTG